MPHFSKYGTQTPSVLQPQWENAAFSSKYRSVKSWIRYSVWEAYEAYISASEEANSCMASVTVLSVESRSVCVCVSEYTQMCTDSWSRAVCFTISLALTVTIVSVIPSLLLSSSHTYACTHTHTHAHTHTHTHKPSSLYKKGSVGSYIFLSFLCCAHTQELVNTVHNSDVKRGMSLKDLPYCTSIIY